jgi:osmotically-inducible protein OsmY
MSNNTQRNENREQKNDSELQTRQVASEEQTGRYIGIGTGEAWRRQGEHTGLGPRNYQRSDERITEDVNERLTQHGEIDARNIEVRVANGEVFLDGTAHNEQAKQMAEETARNVFGVTSIQNNLTVREIAHEEQESSGMGISNQPQRASVKGGDDDGTNKTNAT